MRDTRVGHARRQRRPPVRNGACHPQTTREGDACGHGVRHHSPVHDDLARLLSWVNTAVIALRSEIRPRSRQDRRLQLGDVVAIDAGSGRFFAVVASIPEDRGGRMPHLKILLFSKRSPRPTRSVPPLSRRARKSSMHGTRQCSVQSRSVRHARERLPSKVTNASGLSTLPLPSCASRGRSQAVAMEHQP